MAIHLLTADVAGKIAAGEVVERPASIVKELVENALDAGATRVTVDLQGGGVSVLRVTDDGVGLPRAELPLAFARHATSKLSAIEDLDHLATLGFRGEALASAGAVAEVTFASRPRDAASGASLTMRHGTLESVTATAMPPGTIITVRDCFALVPARLKFLKSAATEAGYAVRVVERYALARPDVAFTVLNEGRLALRSPGDGDLVSAAAAVYDLPTAEQLVALRSVGDANDPATPSVAGLTSRPACFRASRQHIHLFVNRRWVQHQSLSYAVAEAYHSLLLTGRHPVAVVHLTLDPALVDVNVHPAKTEVKFARERQVYAAVQRAVRAAVIQTTEAPAVSPTAFAPPPAGWPSAATDATPDTAPAPPAPALWEPEELRRAANRPDPTRRAPAPPAAPQLPALRVLGQVSQSYIITEGPDGVYLIDQHAAHERILLQKMVAQARARTLPAQLLLEPVVVELTPEIFAAVEERLTELRDLSFDLEPFGAAALLVRAVPAPLVAHATPTDLAELLVDLVGGDGASHGETWEEHALANVACKAAIRAGQPLAPEEQRALVRQLEGVDARHSCCHGRPTTIHLSLEALEREFARR